MNLSPCTQLSALFDDEYDIKAQAVQIQAVDVESYYYFQMIRQTIKGVPLKVGQNETISAHQVRFLQFWARIDASIDSQAR